MRKIKRKIIFGITSLTIGGAERVLVDVANKLSNIYDITIFSIYDNGELKSELNENIHVCSMYKCRYDELNYIRKKWIPLKILLFSKILYRKYIKKDYDVEIAFLEGAITRLLSKKNKKSKKIVWVHNDISKVFGNNFKSKIKNKIDKKIYSKYHNIVFVSKENLKNFQEQYKSINPEKMMVIYNYINEKKVIEKADEFDTELLNVSNKKFVTVCRLVEQKAVDRLIYIHKKLIDNGYVHEIFVIGDGPEKEKLKQIIKKNGVEKSFHLLGKKENPYPYIKQADVFCLLSYFEGYGMVLEEAKILNKKIIITDTAAQEAVVDYPRAHIVKNNINAIYCGLKEIIENDKISDNKKYLYNNNDKLQTIIELLEK